MRPSPQHELHSVRRITDDLFHLLRSDSFYERPIPERHRLVFYLGHLEAFDWNLLGRYALDLPAFHPGFDHIFAFGIDPAAGDLPDDRASDWPGVAEVEAYNQRTRKTIDRVLDQVPQPLLEAAIEHRLMHAETLAYILHQLPYERKLAPPMPDPPNGATPRPAMIEIPAGEAQLGLCAGAGFGWDNEYQAHPVSVPAFTIGKYKVTNRE